jgi:RNA polymerase sigma factor (sigma-70 family)
VFENKQWRKIAIDKDKIDALIQENYMSIYKYCFYHVHNRDVAQDITQDVFLKFIKEIERYREYGKLKNYLYVIARNSIRDHARKIKEIDLETDFEAEKYDDGGIDKKIEQLSVWEALSSLEELEKEILILRYYQDHIIKEISEIMGMPASTIRYKLKNAEKTLKSRLEL